MGHGVGGADDKLAPPEPYPTRTREVGGSMRKGLLGVSRLELPQWASPAHGGASGDKLKLSAVRCGMCTQVAALLLTAYLLTMDMVLMLRLQTLNGDEQEIEARNSSGVVVSSAPSAPSIHWRDLLIPDTAIKGLFMDPMNQHIFMPLAKLTELGLDLHTTAPWLTPDRISVSHVLVAAVGMRFLACRSSLGARQLGVLLFAVRFFLDALDGEVARAVYKMKLSDPGIGSHGHLVDGVCDLAGTVFQLLGTLVLLHAHKECAGLAHACVLTAQWAVLIAASSLGWNSAISRFHDVLEGPGAAPDPVARLLVMRSFWLWVVAWLWRIVNPHALTAMLLGAVFVDKQWEWATWALKRFAVVLFILVLLTEIEFRIASITLSV
ncbi:Ceramide phosphoethanolamine synthase [Frankliniella fusca]|uniref:Ceramide phosphoethanolamine synthase n=1 Tax=Frankliniella fusca TaxID=407009 RepID=A0AAE1LQ99_9NEOP|nr:Ceramide phosphoethanolamine synthase [Frankliniella fusca]